MEDENMISRTPRSDRKSQRKTKQHPSRFEMLDALGSREMLSAFYVSNTSSDSGVQGSLPWALLQANNTPGLDYIDFDLPGGGPHVITLGQTLFLNDQVVIDGTTQPGYAGSPLVYVEGSASTQSLFLLQSDSNLGTTSSGSTIQGLGMYSYATNAVTILNSSQGNWIQNNWMGFFVQSPGNILLNNQLFSPPNNFTSAIGIQSSYNTIRGNTMSGNYNAISMGEDPNGIWSGTIYQTNSIQGNFIGTDPTGTTAAGYGNTSDAVFLGAGVQQNFIGPSNVLSGNQINAVEMLHSSVTANVVFQNFIGTDISGNNPIGNGNLGILIANGANGNAIGGPFGGNIIADNGDGGVAIGTTGFGAGDGNWVQNNIFGLNGDQSAAVGTQSVGISIDNQSTQNVVQGNVIANSTSHGVVLQDVQTNNITQNWIGESSNQVAFANGGFGVALLSGASYNFVTYNAFGQNSMGNIYVDPQAVGNDIQ
jgi:hypothetical protein